MRRLLPFLLAAAASLALMPSPATASSSQEMMFQDNVLLLRDPGHLNSTLATLHSLGVSRVRISVLWDAIAPDPNSWNRPGFNAYDPAAYPAGAWAPYDQIVGAAARYRIGVDFDIMGGAPLWATQHPPDSSQLHVWYPSAAEFGRFASAVGHRYSGHYTPPGASSPLPAVRFWSIWNEPNVGGSSLAPQTEGGVEVAPWIYRDLLRAAYRSLMQTGHAHDTILAGNLASTGHADPGIGLGMQPLRFLRALFCVDSHYRPLLGHAAYIRHCPSPGAFRAQNPGLFNITGWGHHPYHLVEAPDVPSSQADWVTLADLPRLERALDRVQHAYGSHRRLPIYLTEYGFDTNPPQHLNAVSLSLQATYLNEAEYIAWRDPRVQMLSQYLLKDDPLAPGFAYSAFTSGLIFINGHRKPSFYAYQLPVWVPSIRGHSVGVWGSGRSIISITGKVANVAVQFQRGGHGAWKTLRTVRAGGPHGYFYVHVRVPAGGRIRLAWLRGRRVAMSSRTVNV